MKGLAFICACLIVASGNARVQNVSQADSLRQSEAYLQTLTQFEEPSLTPGVEVIRVIVWPTFESPVAVRVEARGEQYQLTAKRLRGQGGYKPGSVNQTKRRQLRRREWEQLQRLLAEAKFWSMATEDETFEPQPDGSEIICLDGTSWLLEVGGSRGYHAVQRYCPEEGGLTAVGRYLVKLSKLRLKEKWL